MLTKDVVKSWISLSKTSLRIGYSIKYASKFYKSCVKNSLKIFPTHETKAISLYKLGLSGSHLFLWIGKIIPKVHTSGIIPVSIILLNNFRYKGKIYGA